MGFHGKGFVLSLCKINWLIGELTSGYGFGWRDDALMICM
jgi:hypothetical protein